MLDLCNSEYRRSSWGFLDWLKDYQFLNIINMIYIYDTHQMVIRVIIFVYINPLNCGPFYERKSAVFVNIFKLTRAWIYIKEII